MVKNFGREAPEKCLQLPPLFQFAPPPHLLGAHAIFCCPVEAVQFMLWP